jgi:hypothetical protein
LYGKLCKLSVVLSTITLNQLLHIDQTSSAPEARHVCSSGFPQHDKRSVGPTQIRMGYASENLAQRRKVRKEEKSMRLFRAYGWADRLPCPESAGRPFLSVTKNCQGLLFAAKTNYLLSVPILMVYFEYDKDLS